MGESRPSLLLLDYDGTLAPFRTERSHAFPYPGVAPLLQTIIRSGSTRVVIVSGRDAGEMAPLLGVEPRPEVWGLHGLQRVRVDGSAELLQPDERTRETLRTAQRWLEYHELQHLAECKTGSVAVHWRGLDARAVEEIRNRVLLGWQPIAKPGGLDLVDFDGGIEIRSAAADKGDAVRVLLGETDPEAPAAYLGDDTTDEPAFEAMAGRGLSVLVRSRWRETAAQLWLKPPGELVDFLTRWRDCCRKRRAFSAIASEGNR